jgi:hypothetical protein
LKNWPAKGKVEKLGRAQKKAVQKVIDLPEHYEEYVYNEVQKEQRKTKLPPTRSPTKSRPAAANR